MSKSEILFLDEKGEPIVSYANNSEEGIELPFEKAKLIEALKKARVIPSVIEDLQKSESKHITIKLNPRLFLEHKNVRTY